MTRGYELYQRYTVAELLEKQAAIQAEPANRTPPGSFWLYTKPARRKLDDIAWAIYYHQSCPRPEPEPEPEQLSLWGVEP